VDRAIRRHGLLGGVVDGVPDDVGDVVVGDLVRDLLAAADAVDDVGRPEDTQVLGDEGLAGAEQVDELVDAEGTARVEGGEESEAKG
jgi:hypothetical protein